MKYDGMLFGNGLTLNLLYQQKSEIPEEKHYLLNVDDYLQAWIKGKLSNREERCFYSALYGNQKSNWNYFELIKKDIQLYYRDFDANIEYAIGKLLFKNSEYKRIIKVFPALYNIWYITLKDYLYYMGIDKKIDLYFEKVNKVIGYPQYIWTTNYDGFGDCLNPQHLHGKFLDKMKKYEDVVYKKIKGGKEYYYKYVWGHNGIGKMENIKQLAKFSNHKKYFDFDFFYDNSIFVEHLLIYGMGFKKSGFTDDLKTEYDRYNHPALGAIIDEHILIRIKELQELGKIRYIDISYFSDDEKIHLQEVLQEVRIDNYRLVKCQDFDFSI